MASLYNRQVCHSSVWIAPNKALFSANKYRILPNYRSVHFSFSKLLWKLVVKYPLKERSAEDCMIGLFNDTYVISFSDFLYKSICCGYLFELPQLVKAIQMSTHNICFYKVVDKNTLTIMKRLQKCLTALIGACVVIRVNTVLVFFLPLHVNMLHVPIRSVVT